ncbi:protein AKTIP homolog isoform X1 [Varroa jacobsoni]|uniref:protein AKTIP homolog isoform X1 n=1 Tax=Varroa jacobsoni TaxID=62625 RepID=UPI000BF9D975|nr:protein AKTIP homolog isoform X1 [Varroa jacobsoni]
MVPKNKTTSASAERGHPEASSSSPKSTLKGSTGRGTATMVSQLHQSHPAPKLEILRTYSNAFLEYTLMNEYAIFRKRFIPGVYIMPSFESALKWFVVLFIRGGVFEGGAFRAQLSFSALHPEGGVPRVTFDPPVFHPLVNALTGEMDISCKIDKWRRDVHHIYQVVEAVKSLFEEIPEQIKPSNREAYKLYVNNKDEFKRVAEECVAQCLEHLQRESPSGGDPNSFDFVAHDVSDLSLSLDEASLFSLRLDSSECSNDVSKSPQRLQGLSWMRDGKPWAKESS